MPTLLQRQLATAAPSYLDSPAVSGLLSAALATARQELAEAGIRLGLTRPHWAIQYEDSHVKCGAVRQAMAGVLPEVGEEPCLVVIAKLEVLVSVRGSAVPPQVMLTLSARHLHDDTLVYARILMRTELMDVSNMSSPVGDVLGQVFESWGSRGTQSVTVAAAREFCAHLTDALVP